MSRNAWLVIILIILVIFFREPLGVTIKEMFVDLGITKEVVEVTGVVTEKKVVGHSSTRVDNLIVVSGQSYPVTQTVYDSLQIGSKVLLKTKDSKLIELTQIE